MLFNLLFSVYYFETHSFSFCTFSLCLSLALSVLLWIKISDYLFGIINVYIPGYDRCKWEMVLLNWNEIQTFHYLWILAIPNLCTPLCVTIITKLCYTEYNKYVNIMHFIINLYKPLYRYAIIDYKELK